MRRYIVLAILFLLPIICKAAPSLIQGEGTGNDIDKHHRGPVVTVSTEVLTGSVKILADTSLPNDQFRKYPVKVDFYVNRKLFSSQFRSPELDGPLGIDVGSDVAALPFNYSVVATVIHPNRQYSSVVQGAVFASTLANTYASCTLSLDQDYVASDVQSSQSAANSISLTFDGIGDSDEHADTTASLQVSGTSLSGTLNVTVAGAQTSYAVSGSAVLDGTKISSFEGTNADGDVSISCE